MAKLAHGMPPHDAPVVGARQLVPADARTPGEFHVTAAYILLESFAGAHVAFGRVTEEQAFEEAMGEGMSALVVCAMRAGKTTEYLKRMIDQITVMDHGGGNFDVRLRASSSPPATPTPAG